MDYETKTPEPSVAPTQTTPAPSTHSASPALSNEQILDMMGLSPLKPAQLHFEESSIGSELDAYPLPEALDIASEHVDSSFVQKWLDEQSLREVIEVGHDWAAQALERFWAIGTGVAVQAKVTGTIELGVDADATVALLRSAPDRVEADATGKVKVQAALAAGMQLKGAFDETILGIMAEAQASAELAVHQSATLDRTPTEFLDDSLLSTLEFMTAHVGAYPSIAARMASSIEDWNTEIDLKALGEGKLSAGGKSGELQSLVAAGGRLNIDLESGTSTLILEGTADTVVRMLREAWADVEVPQIPEGDMAVMFHLAPTGIGPGELRIETPSPDDPSVRRKTTWSFASREQLVEAIQVTVIGAAGGRAWPNQTESVLNATVERSVRRPIDSATLPTRMPELLEALPNHFFLAANSEALLAGSIVVGPDILHQVQIPAVEVPANPNIANEITDELLRLRAGKELSSDWLKPMEATLLKLAEGLVWTDPVLDARLRVGMGFEGKGADVIELGAGVFSEWDYILHRPLTPEEVVTLESAVAPV